MTGEATARSISTDSAAGPPYDDSMRGQDFSLTDQEFDEILAVIKELTGINMSDSKRQLVYRRLRGRLKATNIRTFQDYLDYLRKGDPTEVEAFNNAVTTNLTSFFRVYPGFATGSTPIGRAA